MRFEYPILLWVAPLVALLLGATAHWARHRRVALARSWSAELGAQAGRAGPLGVTAVVVAGLLAALGVAGPRGGRVDRLAEERGLNVLLAIDISRSMLAEDAEPHRLGRAVSEARRLVQDLPGDRIGVIAFAGQSYVLTPLTLDHSAAAMYLEAMDPDLASAGGTEMEGMLTQAEQVLGPSLEGGDRVLVIFTDGEAHDSVDGITAAARQLSRTGVRVVLVAVGSQTPTRIPIRDMTGRLIDYKRDDQGAVVETRRRDDLIAVMAGALDATVVQAEVSDQAGAVRDVLTALTRRPIRERRLADLNPLAWLMALLAMLALLLQSVGRRTAALIGMGGLLLTGSPPVDAQRQSAGGRRAGQGRTAEAEAAFRAQAVNGTAPDTAWYNAGTIALAAGRLAEAEEALAQAAETLDPELRFKALYNLGLVHLVAARRDSTDRPEREQNATERFREALLLSPASQEAKWNLELAAPDPVPPTSGGQNQSPQPPPDPSEGQAPTPTSGELSEAQADAILASVERGELATRSRLTRQQQVRAPAGKKDW